MTRRSLAVFGVVVACSQKPDSATPAMPVVTTPTTITSAAVAAPPAPPPPRPDTGVVSSDAELPPPSYSSLPGWFVMGGRGFPRHIGDSTDADPRAYTGVDIDSGLVVFPHDMRWSRVGTATPLTLLEPDGPVVVYPGAAAEDNPYTPATLLRARPYPAAALRKFSMGWLLPAGEAAGKTALVIRDSVAADSSTKTWMIDSVRFHLRLTGPRSAEFWGARIGGDSVRVFSIDVDSAADEHMGVDSDSLLTLDNWRMPDVVAAVRLGERWPVVAIVYFSGYECSNYSIVIFRRSEITPIEEPHYYECQH